METLLIDVLPEDAGRTLQAVLHDRGGFSHAQARGLIDAGAVRGPVAPSGSRPTRGRGRPIGAIPPGGYAHRVAGGERYEVRLETGRRYRPKARPRSGPGYRVVHEERELLIVDKQPHLLSVPTPLREGEDSLVEQLLESERARGVRNPALYALNRLDRDTSGLLLFARTRRAFEGLESQFTTRAIERLYTAVATGRVEPERGRFESRLVEDKHDLRVRSTRRPGEGKQAITEYRVAERLPGATVLDVRLRTGRRNQIRVHLAEAGHALVGDRQYGTPSPLIDRSALHARSLRFRHPVTGRTAVFESPLPVDLRRLIRALRRQETAAPGESRRG